MNKAVHLKTFSEDELTLNEEQSRLVLKFFFPKFEERIDNAIMSDSLRGFAQGLLVEAIDASYAMGYVGVLFRALAAGILPMERANSTVRIIKTFAKKARAHWFKHATVHDRINVKIYESVRVMISQNFDFVLKAKLSGAISKNSPVVFIDYACVFYRSKYYWS